MEKGRLSDAVPSSIGLTVNSPDELPADLPDAHGTGTGDVSKGVTGYVAARIIELRVVEDVEEFSPKLEGLGFRDREGLLYPKIGVVDAGAMEEPPIGRAKRSTVRTWCARNRIESAGSRRECACIKVSVAA